MIVPDRNRPLVKICGVRDVSAATVATRAGADLLGFMFAESRRKVEPRLMIEVRDALETLDEVRPLLVGVTVNLRAEKIADLIAQTQMDAIQLSGDERPELLSEIDIPVIKTVHVESTTTIDDLRRKASEWLDQSKPVCALLIDTKVPGHYGGTGVRADWSLIAGLGADYPLFLAGGLMPGNVGEGIRTVHPWGVDVSSGVEIDGEKDHALIESFVVRSRQAFHSLQL